MELKYNANNAVAYLHVNHVVPKWTTDHTLNTIYCMNGYRGLV